MAKSKPSMTRRLATIRNKAAIHDGSRSYNFDNGSREFDAQGLKKWAKGERKRAQAAIIEFLRSRHFNVGDYVYVAAETLPEGGSFSYTVEITGDSLYDFKIVGRIRII